MNDILIRAERLGKSYVIGHDTASGGYVALRDVIMHGAKGLWNKTRDMLQGKAIIEGDVLEEVWAVKDINFEVKRGESVGIIGRNGAGKSTLLKILSRITEPSSGRVYLRGRVASLLEVGTGFHPELSGRENIFLNGAILGMRRQEIKKKFDAIVEFSGVEKYLDTPVKRYSSGMYVRLAFSVAAHLEPDILVVDEVLAVGDVAFQKKCLGKMGEVAKGGRTVLFVSHNMGAIQSLCSRAVWLDNGLKKADGLSRDVVAMYLTAGSNAVLFQPKASGAYTDVAIDRAVITNDRGEETNVFRPGEPVSVEVYYNALKRIFRPRFWIGVQHLSAGLFGANMLYDEACPEYIEGKGSIKCVFRNVKLLPLVYSLWLGIRADNCVSNHIPATEIGNFTIAATPEELGLSENAANFYEQFWPLLVTYEWHLPDGQVVRVNS